MLGEVVVAENFCLFQRIARIIALALVLLLSITDWHIFYKKFYEKKYKWYQWVLDYIILGFLSVTLYFAKNVEDKCPLYIMSLFGYVALTFFSYALMWENKPYIDKESKNGEDKK